MTGVTLAVSASGIPVVVVLSVLIACCLPLRRPAGGLARQAVEGVGLGVVRAAVALVAGLGLYILVTVAGAILEAAVARAAQASMDRAVPDPRGPERGA